METHPPRDISRSQSVQDKVFTSVTIDKAELGVGNVNFFSLFSLSFYLPGYSCTCIWIENNHHLTVCCMFDILNKNPLFYLYVLLIGFCLQVDSFSNVRTSKGWVPDFNICFLVFSMTSFCFLRQKIFFLVS